VKVCVISSTVFALGRTGLAGYGGLEQIAWHCAKQLAQRGHEVALVAPQGSACPGVTVIPTGPPGGWDEATAYASYWPELTKFDAVIDHSWAKWSFCLKAEGRLKAPILSVMHAPVDGMYRVWPPAFPQLPPVEKGCAVCISRDQAAHFEALHGRAARVCHNGVDLDWYKPTGVPRSGRFLFLARFSAIKGPHLAIEACRAAGAGLDLVGDTSIAQEPEYFERCRRACDGRQIKMVGPASRGECVAWFSQAHALLHPNQLFREPFGLAPVEAMACGAPVIAWKYGAMRETVLPGETGWLVESADELLAAVNEAAGNVSGQMRQRCRDWAAQYSVEKMGARYDELVHEAVSTGGW